MSAAEGRTCAVCGHVAESTMEHSVHVTLEHPELNRQARRERQATATPSPAARPVSCWRCAGLIPTEDGNRVCPACGWEHPGFEQVPAAAARELAYWPHQVPVEDCTCARCRLVNRDVTDLDHRGRPR